MTYADSTERAALISGLRQLADYLESNPEAPVPVHATVFTFPPNGDWAGMRTAVDDTAGQLGVTAELTVGGHYVANRYFGPVEYRTVAIPPKSDSDSVSGNGG